MSPPGQLTTPVDIISQAFQISSVFGQGQQPTSADTNRVFIQLNAMAYQWFEQRWLMYHNVDLHVACDGSQSYTVGPGGDIDLPIRPSRLEYAYVRLNPASSNPVDFPLAIIPSMENYAQIGLKRLESFPVSIFYDSGLMGKIFPYPIPSSAYEVHIVVKDILTQWPTLTTALNVPPVYIDCLLWNLASRIRTLYGLPFDPSINGLAKAALNVVRGANTQISTLNYPGDMPGGGTGFDPTMGNWNGLPFGSV